MGLLQRAINASGINDRFNKADFRTADWNANSETVNKEDATTNVTHYRDYPNTEYSVNPAAAAPTYVLQSDILQLAGPYLSARSDTFRIRAYGETVDPDNAQTLSEAWVEAIVQRVPTPVEPLADNANEPAEPRSMGRKFQIVSMRWLAPDEV